MVIITNREELDDMMILVKARINKNDCDDRESKELVETITHHILKCDDLTPSQKITMVAKWRNPKRA
jgi:hypothetical protein